MQKQGIALPEYHFEQLHTEPSRFVCTVRFGTANALSAQGEGATSKRPNRGLRIWRSRG